jgi:diguanylate cyclase (GGDEF)-like protein
MGKPALDLAAMLHEDAMIVAQGPLAAPGRLRRLAPYVFVIACAILSMIFNPDENEPVFAVAASLSIAAMGCALWLPWRRLPRPAQGLVILVQLFLTDALMRADGGVNSHFLGILLVPLIWLALYETRGCLFVGLFVTTGLLTAEFLRHPTADDKLRVFVLLTVAVVLLPPLRRMLSISRAAVVALAEMANVDSLTGLANRRGLQQGIQQSKGTPSDGFGIIFVDLNRFKQINDRFGHDAGDQLLVHVGRRLCDAVRPKDVVARIGGDEFVVACNSSRPGVAALADRIRDAIAQPPYLLKEELVVMSASVGFSHLGEQPSDTTALLDEADHAMYLAKAAHG